MHEMALCTEVVKSVLATAEEADAVAVNEVSMVIGEMRDIITDMFDSFFHYLARGTIAENARVSFITKPLLVQCNDCGRIWPVDVANGQKTSCPECAAMNYEVVSGMEFLIESIDVTTRAESEDAEVAA
ncbi:hydrogenase maturation nickel metallochaperone HypA [Adlercreutzia sp. R25]|uniref:Hydrogenase maturation factor HypA n=1 Tax=Adlercreutzia shanghongiae TaxID=3111773 RepID=A0ABU6IXC5_9ACTN|nr:MULTISPECIES: hydrogenase maturation nickel metallochaperone HypA [unclassified Adlercreutzia]MEC4272604.1 hydrogenase maturation nickel metallochaperone HypA [Adlercreutzia sp. R25]MEC4294495.1 hydrogenase maturation nickel metallochaperone HypA [Adlercreutzia sp. R22]